MFTQCFGCQKPAKDGKKWCAECDKLDHRVKSLLRENARAKKDRYRRTQEGVLRAFRAMQEVSPMKCSAECPYQGYTGALKWGVSWSNIWSAAAFIAVLEASKPLCPNCSEEGRAGRPVSISPEAKKVIRSAFQGEDDVPFP